MNVHLGNPGRGRIASAGIKMERVEHGNLDLSHRTTIRIDVRSMSKQIFCEKWTGFPLPQTNPKENIIVKISQRHVDRSALLILLLLLLIKVNTLRSSLDMKSEAYS